MPVVTVKMPKAMHARLEAEAARRRTTKSAIVREHLAAGTDRAPATSFYEKARHYIGAIDGPGDFSARSKKMMGYGRFRRS